MGSDILENKMSSIRQKGLCNICGKNTFFNCKLDINGNHNKKETYTCTYCFSVLRNRIVAFALQEILQCKHIPLCQLVTDKQFYFTCSGSPILSALRTNNTKNITCSEYYDDVPRGSVNGYGIYSQDLTSLTFLDNSFDIVITEAVFEHINDPEQAFKEVFRVLKKGGHHILHVPFDMPKTRIRILPDGTPLLPINYHKDPLRKEGIPVYTDFGYEDTVEFIKKALYPNIMEFRMYNIENQAIENPEKDLIVITSKKI